MYFFWREKKKDFSKYSVHKILAKIRGQFRVDEMKTLSLIYKVA